MNHPTPTLEINGYKLTVDGVPLPLTHVSGVFSSDGRTYKEVLTYNDEDTKRLFAYTLSQFKEIEVEEITLRFSIDWQPVGALRFRPEDNSCALTVYFDRVYLWSRPYTFSEYFDLLVTLINELDANATYGMMPDETSADMYPPDDFAVHFSVSADVNIGQEVERCISVVRLAHDKAIAILNSKVESNSVELWFNFPEEVRIPCEQYLLYFVQFLRDLGVEATADLRREAGKVLFAVTPVNKETALDNIRTALQTYLQLPSSSLDTDSIVEYEIAAQRLAANVDHLRGQVRLVNAELRLANATIQQQRIAIDHLLTNDLVLKTLEVAESMPVSDEPERLLGGTVAVGTFEKYGVRVNLGEIFRRLRRIFGNRR